MTVQGESAEYVRVGDEGDVARFHFYPKRGATVFYLLDAMSDVVAVLVGVFADTNFPLPRISVYEERMHRWVELPQDIEHID